LGRPQLERQPVNLRGNHRLEVAIGRSSRGRVSPRAALDLAGPVGAGVSGDHVCLRLIAEDAT
jgi:hypothetical protein